jgi:hypothetical protein
MGPWSKQKTVEVKVETKEEDDSDLNEKLAQALRNHVPLQDCFQLKPTQPLQHIWHGNLVKLLSQYRLLNIF